MAALVAGSACGGTTGGSGQDTSAKAPAPLAESAPPKVAEPEPAPAKAEAQGPAAPALRLAGWVGSPPALGSRPRLVAAWATWCPACRGETAMLAALAKKYAGKVDVFALSDETADKVKSFGARLSAPVKLDFPVALSKKSDDDQPITLDAHYRAVGMRNDILPHAFAVVSDKIVWHGDAGDAAAVLDEVLATGDAARARRADEELGPLRKRYREDFAAGGREGSRASAAALLKAARGHASFLNDTAWPMVDADGGTDLEFGLELARAGVEASGEADYHVLDTLGLALWKTGKKAEALAVQKKCVALCNALGGDCPEEKARLQKFLAP